MSSNDTDKRSSADIFFTTERQLMGIDCKVCDNNGYLIKTENDLLQYVECECMTVYRNKLRIKKSGLLKVLDMYTFDKFIAAQSWQKEVKKKAYAFLNQNDKWFYIGGTVGSGKSHICTAICLELMKSQSVYYMPWRDDIVPIKANVNKDEEYQKLVSKLKIVDVLYVDDFLKGKYTDGDLHVAFEVLNHRYINRFTTIISSEKTISDIIAIDQAIGSRIYQMAGEFETTLMGMGKNIRLRSDNT